MHGETSRVRQAAVQQFGWGCRLILLAPWGVSGVRLVGRCLRSPCTAVLLICGDHGSGRAHLLAALKGVAGKAAFVASSTSISSSDRRRRRMTCSASPGRSSVIGRPALPRRGIRLSVVTMRARGQARPVGGRCGRRVSDETVGLLRRTVVESRIFTTWVTGPADARRRRLPSSRSTSSVERLVPALRSVTAGCHRGHRSTESDI
jgi:hypothetical protein